MKGHSRAATALRAALVSGNTFGENAFMWAAALGHLDCASRLWRECYLPIFLEEALAAEGNGEGEKDKEQEQVDVSAMKGEPERKGAEVGEEAAVSKEAEARGPAVVASGSSVNNDASAAALEPLFFSNEFVEWILDGRKTATTRVEGFECDAQLDAEGFCSTRHCFATYDDWDVPDELHELWLQIVDAQDDEPLDYNGCLQALGDADGDADGATPTARRGRGAGEEEVGVVEPVEAVVSRE